MVYKLLTVSSPAGELELSASARGLTGLRWCSSRASGSCKAPATSDPALCAGMEWLRAYFAGAPPARLPPLATAGTDFEQTVWDHLAREVPFGTTTSYGEIARQLGKPGAARAVGGANRSNPLPIFIPCHRVLAAGGKLGGYSAGLARKRWLLAHEGMPVMVELLRARL